MPVELSVLQLQLKSSKYILHLSREVTEPSYNNPKRRCELVDKSSVDSVDCGLWTIKMYANHFRILEETNILGQDINIHASVDESLNPWQSLEV